MTAPVEPLPPHIQPNWPLLIVMSELATSLDESVPVSYTHLDVYKRQVREGFEHVVELTGLMGRWQVLQENPKVVCDTGHNVGGWQYLNIQLEEELKRHKHLFMIVGMVNDKDIDGVLDLMPENAFYFFTQASVQRAMPAEDFATKAIFHGLSGTICDSVQEAVEKALARAGQDVYKRQNSDETWKG